jgi:hypothetical protein
MLPQEIGKRLIVLRFIQRLVDFDEKYHAHQWYHVASLQMYDSLLNVPGYLCNQDIACYFNMLYKTQTVEQRTDSTIVRISCEL